MNRSPRNISALVGLAFSLFLSSAVASEQNLPPEQQKQDLCQTNKNYIADYKRQGQELNRVASFMRKDQAFRDQYSKLNQAIVNDRIVQVGDGEEMRRVAEMYGLEWKELWNNDYMAFQKALRDRMTSLIDMAAQYRSVKEVEAKIDNIIQQIKFHENRLQLLGCDESSGEKSPDISGTWGWECCDRSYSGTMSITQKGNKLSGDFNGNPIEGAISGSTVTFKRTGSWGRQDYTLTLSADGKTLTGTFDGYRNTSVGVDFKATRR